MSESQKTVDVEEKGPVNQETDVEQTEETSERATPPKKEETEEVKFIDPRTGEEIDPKSLASFSDSDSDSDYRSTGVRGESKKRKGHGRARIMAEVKEEKARREFYTQLRQLRPYGSGDQLLESYIAKLHLSQDAKKPEKKEEEYSDKPVQTEPLPPEWEKNALMAGLLIRGRGKKTDSNVAGTDDGKSQRSPGLVRSPPSKTEPATTESAATEPAGTKSPTTKPVQNSPVKTEQSKTSSEKR